MDPISVAGLAIAVAQVTGACLKASWKIVGPSQHSSKDLQELNTELYSFNAAVGNLQAHLKACEDDPARLHALSGLEEPLRKSKEILELIKPRLEDVTFIRKLRKHVLGANFDKRLKSCLRSLKMSRTLFAEVLQMDQRTMISAIERHNQDAAKDVTSMKSNLQTLEYQSQQNHKEMRTWQVKAEQQKQDDKDRKTLNWLSSLNFVTKQNDVLRTRHEETGAWFLKSSQFEDWLAGPPRMLWCPGIPGAGKTVLASISVDHLKTTFKDQDSAVLCVFCNYADQGHQTSTDLVASLLEQLVRTKGVTGEIRALYGRHPTQSTRPGLAELSELLYSMVKDSAKVFIVIDGLDECSETTRGAFVAEMYKLRSYAHLMVTSRPASAIAHAHELEFQGAIHLEIYATNTDLEMYIRAKIRRARWLEQDLPLQEKVVATMVDNAKGMFLLVHLHLESLANQKNKRDLRKALSSLPEEIDETYDQTMARIRSQDTESVRLAERALAWISNARRPLSVEELQHALAIQPGEANFDEEAIYPEDVLVSVCAGLVTVDRKSHVIRLVHYTTQDYFDHVRSEMFPIVQAEITEACLSYLLLDDFDSDEFTRGEGHIEVSNELHSRYPFLEYAGRHWGHHARGYAEYCVGEMIYRLVGSELRCHLACDLIDDSGIKNFGPRPTLTILVYFGLEHFINLLPNLDADPCPTCAIRYREDIIVFFLVERDTYLHDTGELFPLSLSFFELEGNEDMVRLLADKGITMDLSVDNGEFLFNMSWLKSGTEGREPMLTLLELGATFNPQNITYYTPLMCAVIEWGNSFNILKLLKSGVSVSEKNEHGRDALIYATLARHEAVVRPLLEAGADVDSRDEYGMTALSAACEGGNAEIVKVLLEHGADVSAQDKDGRTPMSIATGSGNAILVRLLRGEGMDDNPKRAFIPGTRDRWNAVWHLIKGGDSIGSPEYKPVEVARPGAVRRGYDKTVPAWVDEYLKMKAREKDCISDDEEDPELANSDGSN